VPVAAQKAASHSSSFCGRISCVAVSIKQQIVEEDLGTALVKALDLAKSIVAKSLPGWSGADPATN
jgi:hypothetical protein